MIKEIPLGFNIVEVKGGFAVARTQGIPSIEIDSVYDSEIIPRKEPYKSAVGAKIGLSVLLKNGRI